jgi:hypothetical protein
LESLWTDEPYIVFRHLEKLYGGRLGFGERM